MGGVPASNLAGSSAGSNPSERHAADHAAAAQERRHGVQQRLAAVQDPDSRRPQHLVTAERHEIGVPGLHIGRRMRHALRRVDQHQRTGRVRLGHDLRHRIDRAQHIRDRRDRHQARPFVEQCVERLEDQESVVGDRDETAIVHPVRSASCCQGTMLEWCSISVSRISSPGPHVADRPNCGPPD